MRAIMLIVLMSLFADSACAQECLKPDIQRQAIANFNSNNQLTKRHGKVIALKNIRNPEIEVMPETRTYCAGIYTFEDGTSEDMNFSFSTENQNKILENQRQAKIDLQNAKASLWQQEVHQCIKDNFSGLVEDYLGQQFGICARAIPWPN